jgi:hypothetical protein
MHGQRARRVDRGMINASNFGVRFMIAKELFPMRYALRDGK